MGLQRTKAVENALKVWIIQPNHFLDRKMFKACTCTCLCTAVATYLLLKNFFS